MTTHQQDHEPVEVVFKERIARRLHSWLLIMCLGYPMMLLLMFLFGHRLATDYVFSGLCIFIGTVYPIALVIILTCIKLQGNVAIPWFLIFGPAVWIAALSWFYIWLIGEIVGGC